MSRGLVLERIGRNGLPHRSRIASSRYRLHIDAVLDVLYRCERKSVFPDPELLIESAIGKIN